MKKRPTYRNSLFKLQKVEELEKNNARFKRVYSEYKAINSEIDKMQMDDDLSIPDDFIEAMRLQSDYLEDEIKDWLTDNFSQTDA